MIAGFPAVPPWFRRAFPYSKWGAELNAAITPAFFSWLARAGRIRPAIQAAQYLLASIGPALASMTSALRDDFIDGLCGIGDQHRHH